MLVTKKRLYTELCKLTDVIHEVISVVELEKQNRRLSDDDLVERINYVLEKLCGLEERVEKLEAKRAYHKKQVKPKKK